MSSTAAAFERAVPHVIGNPFIPHWPHPKQARALGLHTKHDYARKPIFELLYGGAAGGGKSDWLLMAAAQYAWRFSHFRALLLRRTYAELAKSGALMSRAMEWWIPAGAHWNGSLRQFTFPSGAIVEFGYHAHPKDNAIYQGGEWHLVGMDELTHWPDADAFEWLSSRLRKGTDDPIPLRQLGASNPGSAGHVWVKNRFIGGYDLNTGERVEAASPYLPATIDDNPSLDRESYKLTLRDMHPTRRQQLLDGNWDARDPGDYFRVEWFGPLVDEADVPKECVAVRWWDLAASESKDAARTASCRMVRLRSGVRVVTHATAWRATPGRRDARIVQQAQTDGRKTVVGLEIEGGSGGVAQFEALAGKLRSMGYRVVGARPRPPHRPLTHAESGLMARNPIQLRGKEARADPVASCLERGYQRRGECDDTGETWWGVDADEGLESQRDGLRLVVGPWTQGYVDELEGFPHSTLCDLVDATSGAWAWLEAHPYGLRKAPGREKEHVPAEVASRHPEDRPALITSERDIVMPSPAAVAALGRSRNGHWTP